MCRSGKWRIACGLTCAFGLLPSTAHAAQQESPADLRTFILEKPPADLPQASAAAAPDASDAALNRRPLRDSLRTMFGLGYVQGADWGSDIVATGAVSGVEVQLDSLLTRGARGFLFDHGSLKLSHPENGWRAEAGDLFSNLTGPARGGRVSWLTAGGREPALSVYGPMPGLTSRPTVVAYRDQIRWSGQTLLDAEIASDASHFVRSRVSRGRLDLETSYRRAKSPVRSREGGVQMSASLWRGAALGAGFFAAEQTLQHASSTTLLLRIPASRFVALTIERAIATAGGGVNASAAATADVTAGQLRLLHRYQWGVSRFTDQGLRIAIDREQFQSMASYAAGPRFGVSLQTVTEWRDTGRMPQWEELQAAVRLTRDTRLQLAAAVPHLLDSTRLRAQLTQALGSRYALEVEYGRPSAFQSLSFEADRPRIKLMLHRIVNVSTARRGGEVRGRVVDELGRPVSSARVTLGPYAADTSVDGAFVFRDLPRGEYDLALDDSHLPADYAWDGRRQRLTVMVSSRLQLDLIVTPLNSIHGRVYADRNGNGRFDNGEAVEGAVMRLQDRVTTTDRDGAYSFYNLWPGHYVIRLDAGRLPEGVEAAGAIDRAVTLEDGRPVTEADFVVIAKAKPIVWKEIK